MKSVLIEIPTIEKVQQFVGTVTRLDGDFDLISGRYILDARSLMGIFGFDLSLPITLKIYEDTPETMEALRDFIVPNDEEHSAGMVD